ncbi:bifunctional tRNA (5-methylaminomethyl-2-thiouridine)(34)-methyltransferase MnmD/FAD-dependent 5-carboxymethylaminomethyl-2-thiouridine(34) oxidoreductase MnmC, partial [Leptospira gomenensis]
PEKKRYFSVLELGFGTGLNFFATWKEYADEERDFELHYVSVEKFPIKKEEIEKAVSVFPELGPFLSEFVLVYRNLLPGINRFTFADGKVRFSLFYADAADALDEISGTFDVIYLDGFAPSKNPEMWSETLLRKLGPVSRNGTTFATFTVARSVRDSMTSAGFIPEKKPGFGRKREMLTGTFAPNGETDADVDPSSSPDKKPWCRRDSLPTKAHNVAIVGAGIAGSALAYSLAQRGISVVLLDPNGIAGGASGIPGAVSHPHPTKYPSPISLFTLRAFAYAVRFLTGFASPEQFSPVGVFHGVTEEMDSERLRNSIRTHSLTEGIAFWSETGVPQTHPDRVSPTQEGVFYPEGFWSQPGSLAQKAVQRNGIRFLREKAASIKPEDQGWELTLSESDEKVHANSVIFCNSYSINELLYPILGEEFLPIRKVRGQLIRLREPPASPTIRNILCAEHYLTPSIDGAHILGSTFDEFDLNPKPRKEDTDRLLAYVLEKYPAMNWSEQNVVSEVVGFRAQTPDRFPVIGPVFDPKRFRKEYSGIDLHKNRDKTYPSLKTIPGLYVFGGLGSRGIIGSFLGAEILASLILDEPAPVEKSLLEALHPGRFLYRKIRKVSETEKLSYETDKNLER